MHIINSNFFYLELGNNIFKSLLNLLLRLFYVYFMLYHYI